MPQLTTRALVVRMILVAIASSTVGCDRVAATAPVEDLLTSVQTSPRAFATPLTLGGAITVSSGATQRLATGSIASTPLSVRFVPRVGGVFTVPVTWTIRSGDGSLSEVASKTDGNGMASALFTASSTSGITVINASVIGLPPLTFTMETYTELSSVPASFSVVSLSRDGGSVRGGTSIRITGSGFGANDAVMFGNVPATNVTQLDAFSLEAKVPAGTVGTVPVRVTHNGVTASLAGAWTYYAAPTVFLANNDFENGYGNGINPAMTPSGGDSVYITSEKFHSGSHSVKQVAARSGVNDVAIGGGAVQNDIVSGTGRYHRYYLFMPAATLAKTATGGQIKLFLSRELSGVQSFVVLAVGPESSDPAQFGANAFTAQVDQYGGSISRSPIITADTWHELQVYEFRDPISHQGTARIWYDGKLVGEKTDALLGSDVATNFRGWQFGLVYTQNTTYPISVFVDDIVVANGYIDP